MYSHDQMLLGKTDKVDNTDFVRGNEFSYPKTHSNKRVIPEHKYPIKDVLYYHNIKNRFYPNDLNKSNKKYKVYPNTSNYLSDFPFFKISEPFTNSNDYYKTNFMKYILNIPITIIIIIFIICSPISSISFTPPYKTSLNNGINIRRKLNIRKQQNTRSNLMTLSLLMSILCVLYIIFRIIFDNLFNSYPTCKGITDFNNTECQVKGNKDKLYDNCKECLMKNEKINDVPINKCQFEKQSEITTCNAFENNDSYIFKNYFVENYIIFFLIAIFLYLYMSMNSGKSSNFIIILTILVSIGIMIYSSVTSDEKMEGYEILIYTSYFLFYGLCILLLINTNIFEITMKNNL